MRETDSLPPLSVGQCATLASLLEASIPKPGNVHRGADFHDLTYYDFVASAVAIGPALDVASAGARLGPTVLGAVKATRQVIRTNANLGTILLLAPLAMAAGGQCLSQGIADVLANLDQMDAALVYEAIRQAQPGSMRQVKEADLNDPAPADLLAAMRLAADRDLVARQYAGGFREIFEFVVPALQRALDQGWSLIDAVIRVHLESMAAYPDSLIARKCGAETARQSATAAAAVLAAGTPGDSVYRAVLADFDFWLRADGNRRNPGTTADLIAAGLFVALRERIISPPFEFTAT